MISTRSGLKPDISRLNPDEALPNPAPDAPTLRDGWWRLVGIPFFGLLIPRLTDLLGRLTWSELDYWLGTLWFIGATVVLWEGNRWLVLRQRAALRPIRQPLVRTVVGAASNVVFTIPVTVAAVALWQRYIGAPYPASNFAVVSLVTTNTVIAVVLATQAYEMLFLQQERDAEQLRGARLERARLLAELEAVKGQLAPHFLFNCLNTLTALIEEDPKAAVCFNQNLAEVSRYLLQQKNRDLVPLAEELAFIHAYVQLMQSRFGEGVRVRLVGFEQIAGLALPPASLQGLVENALKHNRFGAGEPLTIEVRREGDTVVVTNPLRPKALAVTTTGTGLRNLRERVQLLAGGRELHVTMDRDAFVVRLPLCELPRASELARDEKHDRPGPARFPE